MVLRFLANAWLMVVLLGGMACDWREQTSLPVPASQPAGGSVASSQPAEQYAGSASCAECHREVYAGWRGSHHARAQRELSGALDHEAFSPGKEIHHGTQISSVAIKNGRYVLTAPGRDGQLQDFYPTGALGVFPLWQYLIAEANGRVQVTELAWDPAKKEWFNVYGQEDRRGGEWGHWTGRGMCWNSMCAMCHTSGYGKNYDQANDSYQSTWRTAGVDCEQCHGPMKGHVDWQAVHPNEESDPTIQVLDNDEYMAVCGSCHARRGELTGRFKPGEGFLEHYDPALPDLADVFYPDGQVRDEDFEYAAFMLSYMQAVGVRCFTCHDSHSGKTRKAGNDLCLQCHERKMTTRIAIDPVEHGHHPAGKGGSLCVDCHMPQTVYMARHWRHDHGLTIPDPLLTKEWGIPNACTRCHAKEGVDWAVRYVQDWYGQRMERPTRRRARVLGRIKAGDMGATADLLGLLGEEEHPGWRAVYTRFLAAAVMAGNNRQVPPEVLAELARRLDDSAPLVQASAVDVLAPWVPTHASLLVPKLQSPSRLVRVKAAWALRQLADLPSPAQDELMAQIELGGNQPTGVFQKGTYYADRGQTQESLSWFAKAIRWDPASAPFRYSYAVALSRLRRLDEALVQMAKASDLEPAESLYPYSLGLLYAEMGRMVEAREALRAAVSRNPRQGRYWYNLALAEDKLGDTGSALEAVHKAEDLDPGEPAYPYARATIHLKRQEPQEARAALERTLQLEPSHQQARALLDNL